MTRTEAEDIFITAILSGETTVVEMKLSDSQIFRVFVGKLLKEIEKRNYSLWLKARSFTIKYKEPYTILEKLEINKYKMYHFDADGKLVLIYKEG